MTEKQYPDLPALHHPEHTMTWMESELRAIHRYARDYVDATCAMRAAQPAHDSRNDTPAFQNFHRALCERFGYVHDVNDWRRDQVSLIEHIAKLAAQPENAAVAGLRRTDGAVFDPHGALAKKGGA